MSNLSRRNFLKGAALGALGMTAMSAGVALAEDKAAIAWDAEADIVVVGTGTAVTAAIAANEFGAEKIIVLEKDEAIFGGTSASSGHGYALPGYLKTFEGEGIEDSREKCETYMYAVGEDRMSAEVMASFLDNAEEYVEWAKGVWGWSKLAHTSRAHDQYYELYPGAIPFGRGSAFPIDAEGNQVKAGAQWKAYREYIESRENMTLMMGTEATKLITDENGAVIGLYAKQGDKTIAIKAGKGVVLGTGGFDYNEEMRKASLPFPIFRSCASRMNTGDGQKMGARLGARLAMMDRFFGTACIYDEPVWNENDDRNYGLVRTTGYTDWTMFLPLPHSIMVNRKGKRFGNESRAYDNIARAFSAYDTGVMKFENIPGFFIADSQYTKRFKLPSFCTAENLPAFIFKYDTLEELADGMGIDKEGLLAEVARYNEFVKNGEDKDWHRGESEAALGSMKSAANGYCKLPDADNSDLNTVKATLGTVEQGPFYCARYVPNSCGTRGGLVTNGKAQVLNQDNEAIPGLYAVGCCSAGVAGYWAGGACISQGSVMSYIAVKDMLGK